jgi:predicted short-subunit dehydrogenase-like oxidoreductase (DUF2520 family)
MSGERHDESGPESNQGARPARLRVGVIGTGRVGAVLGAALNRAGHRVVAVSGVSHESQSRAAVLLPGVERVDAAEVVRRSELVVVAVPDDQLVSLAEGLADVGAVQAGQLVVHTSGRYGVGVLAPMERRHALPLALHPAMTFTGTEVDVARLTGSCFAVTSAEPLRPIAEALVVEMGADPVWISEEYRVIYHAALAIGSNHLVTLVTEAMELLRLAGVESPSQLLAPLLGASLDNALRFGDAALTGPVARGDAGTVAAHREQIAAVSPRALDSYVALSRLAADRALASGQLSPESAGSLLAALSGPLHGGSS